MRIDHAAMYVNNLEKDRDFFEDGARLELMTRPGMEDPDKTRQRAENYRR